MQLYPLKMNPVFQARPWGGRLMKELLGKDIPEGPIGESWEISAHPHGLSTVANGELAGKSLPELIKLFGAQLLGKEASAKYKDTFPLLVKLIDVNALPSVQVHPDDAAARRLEHFPFGKTEAWYIITAKDTAEFYLGFQKGVAEKDLLVALRNGTVKNILNRITVKNDSCVFVPPGTVHACGNGVFLLEIQQSCDITYRVYDWDRVDASGRKRELHIEKALQVIDFNARASVYKAEKKENTLNKLIATEKFSVFETRIKGDFILPAAGSFLAATVIEGTGRLSWGKNEIGLKTGESFFIPPGIATGIQADNCTVISASLLSHK